MKKEFKISLQIIGLLFIFIHLGCETHYLTKKSNELQPYQKGDILIFEKNKEIKDTLWITEIEKYVNPDDPLDIFPTRYQTMFVSGEISMRETKNDIFDRPIKKRFQQVLEIESSKDKNDHFLFVFDNKNEPFRNPTSAKTLNELSNCFKTNNNLCNIQAKEHNSNLDSQKYDLASFKWSSRHGYISFNYSNGDKYELIEFWRKNKNVLD